MTVFFQSAAAVLLAAVLGLTLSAQGKDLGILLTLGVCAMVLTVCLSFLQPVLEFLRQLEALGELDRELIRVLFKIAGIGLVSEMAGMICADAGNPSLGKAINMLGTSVILWLSLPVFQGLLELIQEVLGGI